MEPVVFVLMYLDMELYGESFWSTREECVVYAIDRGFSEYNREDDSYGRADGRDDYVTIVSLSHL